MCGCLCVSVCTGALVCIHNDVVVIVFMLTCFCSCVFVIVFLVGMEGRGGSVWSVYVSVHTYVTPLGH